MPDYIQIAAQLLEDPVKFAACLIHPARQYQAETMREIAESVRARDGRSFVVLFPRQAGKNETSAMLETFLLNRYQRDGGQIVKAAPSFAPQAINSMMRLAKCLGNEWNAHSWRYGRGYMIELGAARAMFFSAHPQANVVGATASLLLECDESQDVDPSHWRKTFVPMAASTNATRIYYGTPWTSDTLLSEELRAAEEAERKDGKRRVFRYTWERIAQVCPLYGAFVSSEIERLGADHPIIKTQYMLEEIDAAASLFTPARLGLMRGDHDDQQEAQPGRIYAMLVDPAGEANPEAEEAKRQDTTVAQLVEVDPSSIEAQGAPTYRTVHRRAWQGANHAELFHDLLAIAREWNVRQVVIDATGLGAGLAAFMERSLGKEHVIKVQFSAKEKSDLGWGFIALIETDRYKEHTPTQAEPLQGRMWAEARATRYTIQPGAGKRLSWSASPHDDFITCAALTYKLDALPWREERESHVIEGIDPLDDRRHHRIRS